MLPIIRVPEILAKGMESFRKIFCRAEGFEHICRFITGLILSPNKTLQGIYDLQVWEGEAPSRRAMHEAVFESGWDRAAFIHQLQYRKRTEIAVEIVRQLETEGQFPQAHYAFDNGVLTLELTRLIESRGKHWASEVEVSRHIQWQGHWRRVDEVGAEVRQQHPESFRKIKVSCRNGEEKVFFAFTKVVRLKRYGRKRLVIVHEREDLTDAPRFLLTDALHWESGRVIQTWSYRWA